MQVIGHIGKEWKKGEIRRLLVKGGHGVNLSWRDGAPVRLEILFWEDAVLKVRYGQRGGKSEIPPPLFFRIFRRLHSHHPVKGLIKMGIVFIAEVIGNLVHG